MADRLSSDHPSVRTVRATLSETTTGVRLEIPGEERDSFVVDDLVRVTLEGAERFARVERALTGDELTIEGVYETADGARDPRDGTDVLPDWCDEQTVRDGGSVLIDVIEPGFAYGIRSPGETAYYDASEPPKSSLSDIANDIDGS
ncbi:hypothetical protein HALLA_16540 [Halostagnicola larsenii XH-48]|uniref:Uncharacterized protein n=1 Tax=Halostagnicola larsenii XH-48 TaxID=797299 RepID=W0JT17_9EURY|nr:hypothetical protein [Halostagnicola larsenii]AHG00168.1 hypothetical protein HALLA_16540 [Halostagnicola larsenii XH-48]